MKSVKVVTAIVSVLFGMSVQSQAFELSQNCRQAIRNGALSLAASSQYIIANKGNMTEDEYQFLMKQVIAANQNVITTTKAACEKFDSNASVQEVDQAVESEFDQLLGIAGPL